MQCQTFSSSKANPGVQQFENFPPELSEIVIAEVTKHMNGALEKRSITNNFTNN